MLSSPSGFAKHQDEWTCAYRELLRVASIELAEVLRSPAVVSSVVSLLHSLRFLVRSRAALHLEIITLRHQLAVRHRARRPGRRFTSADGFCWASLSQVWRGWRSTVHIIKPETDIACCRYQKSGTPCDD